MKKYLLVLAALTLQLSCQPESNSGDIDNGNKSEEEPVFCLADISDYTDAFDKVICTDEAHVLFTKYYDSGLVEEYFGVCEQDTVALFFDVSGVPKLLTTGKNHILFGNFSENSALIGIADNDGNYTVEDCDFGVNWREYIEAISSRRTKADNGRDNLLEHVQSNVVENILTFGAGITSGFMNPLWVAEALAYMISDNPVYQVVTNFSFSSLNVYLTVAEFGALAGGLLLVDVWLISHDLSLIWNGIKNGDFSRNPWRKYDPELFTKIIECGVWFGAGSEATLDWQAQQGSVPIKIGVPNFDYNNPHTFEIGVKKGITLPKDWKAEVVGSGLNYTLNYSISANLGKNVITGDIPVYVTGVSNIDEDLVFTIHQTPQIQLNPEVVYFADMNPVTVTVTSLSKEDWEVVAWPDWIDYQESGFATQATNSITLTPKTLEGVSPTDLIISVTTSDGHSHYEKHLPIYPFSKEVDDEHKLRDLLIQFYIDTDGDNWVHNDNWCSDKPIHEWYGVRDYYGLIWLDMSSNHLSGSANLANFKSLGLFYCDRNQLTSINLSGCTSLEQFCSGEGKLKSLDVSGCKSLVDLECNDELLTSLNISGCTYLKRLGCYRNRLSSLDMSSCTSLEELYCQSNQLSTLDVSACKSLYELHCTNNRLTSINVSGCVSLKRFFCDSNQLTSLDVSQCVSLQSLVCIDNKIQQQIRNEDSIAHFEYDIRYQYWEEMGEPKWKDNIFGWWYPGEPEKGYHGR